MAAAEPDMGSSTSRVEVIDAQVHLFEANCARYPWTQEVLTEPRYEGMRGRFNSRTATPAEALGVFDAHGVHGALVVHPSIYGFDNSYSTDAYRFAPDRFRVVGLVDSSRPDIEDAIAAFAADPAFVGVRLSLYTDEAVARFDAGAENRMLAAAQREGLVVCVYAPGRFSVFERIAQEFPELTVVLDHFGLFSIDMLDPAVRDTFGQITSLFPLARYENVAVKITSLPLLSREEYPFRDGWPHVLAVIEAFGVERLMWGSDAFGFHHPYHETLDYLAQSDELDGYEKLMLLGGALRRVWKWPAEGDGGG
jgi:L-fuconolactonase